MNLEQPRSHWRFNAIGIAFVLMGIAISIQLIRIQISPQADIFRKLGDQYAGYWRDTYPARGQIYDRWGRLLAGNKIVYQIGLELREVEDPEGIAFAMMAVLGEDYERMLEIASQPADPSAVFAVLVDFVPPEKVLQMQRLAEQVQFSTGEDQPIRSLAGLSTSPICSAATRRKTSPPIYWASSIRRASDTLA